jgi:hypothetical protein
MAHPNVVLIEGLRKAASQLRQGAFYEWGNHGACNCGNLLQAVTALSQEEIQAYALTGIGEWTEIAESWCPVTDAPVNLLMSKLEEIGLTPSDIHHLEYLDNRDVLQRLKGGMRWLRRNQREDVIDYFETFADLLEEQMVQLIDLEKLIYTRERGSEDIPILSGTF